MAKNKFYLSFAVLSVFLLLLISGCVQNNPQNGTLQGRITIGPLCPVETNPPDPSCLPNEQTYAAYQLTVYKVNFAASSSLEKFATFQGDKDGNYRIELPEGNYELAQETGLSRYQQEFVIKAGEATALDIDIDTGIR